MIRSANKKQTGVSIVDGSLVLSFPHAAEPVVWRMNLAQAKEAGFEIRETKGKFRLVQKSMAGEQDIAAFDTRDSAVDALMQVSAALQGGRAAANDSGTLTASERTQWIIAIVGVLTVVSLFFYLTSITPVENNLQGGATAAASGATQTTTAAPADPQSSNGVAVSADDFLRGE